MRYFEMRYFEIRLRLGTHNGHPGKWEWPDVIDEPEVNLIDVKEVRSLRTSPRTYLPPYNTPEECDHEGAPAGACSHCCPCDECGAIRADNAAEETNTPE